jgi:two-component system LytT family sensor kinase
MTTPGHTEDSRPSLSLRNHPSPRLFLAAAGACAALGVVFTIQEYTLSHVAGQPESWLRAIAGVAPHYVLWALMSIPILLLAARFPLQRPRRAAHAALHFLFCLLFYALEVAISIVVLPMLLHDPRLTPLVLRLLSIRTFYDDFLLYWVLVGVSHLMAEQGRRAALQRELAVAELNVLRAQLQPHFLFNTLNSISELMHVDVAAAEQMTASLSDLLRFSLDRQEAQEIALRDELEMLDVYLRIQQVRFSDSVTVDRVIEGDTLDALVPSLLLQPIVENAFRHGLSRRRQQGRVRVDARRVNWQVRIEIADNGVGLPPGGLREGIGLRNTRVRLEQLYRSEQTLTLAPAEGGGLRVVITFPYRSEIEEAR